VSSETARSRTAALVRDLPGVERVLDAPAGAGDVGTRLAATGCRVTLLDVAPGAFASGSGLPSVRADLNAPLPFGPGSFDAVLCREGIEHVENQFETARQFRRVLRDEGWLVVSTPNLLCLRARLATLLVGGATLRFRPPPDDWPGRAAGHVNLHGYPALRVALVRAGFRIERATSFGWSRSSLALAPLVPLIWLFTRRAFARVRDPAQRASLGEVRRHVLSPALLFGKKLVLVARAAS
jgi:SAM-dependent methyltransferase